MPKIISKCCELVKLCHINRGGPVFFETHCSFTHIGLRWWRSTENQIDLQDGLNKLYPSTTNETSHELG